MIDLQQRVAAFSSLGIFINNVLQKQDDSAFEELCYKAESKNPWFTFESIVKALKGIARILQKSDLELWVQSYPFLVQKRPSKVIAVIMAGNIPLVGFHDALTVLMSGNTLLGKLSSKDDVLLPWLMNQLIKIEPAFDSKLRFETNIIKDFDAVIATGSSNSSRYFDYYFKKYPSIIRKNRVSVAVLNGQETDQDIERLADDIFSYFGLGCRNVSKIFIPEHFDLVSFIAHFDNYSKVCNHNKYLNNYEYNKSIYLLNQDAHLDNGYALFKEDEKIFSPIAVVFYEKYKEIRNLDSWLERNRDDIQCVVSNEELLQFKTVHFGTSQMPSVFDYADNIDTMSFIETLN